MLVDREPPQRGEPSVPAVGTDVPPLPSRWTRRRVALVGGSALTLVTLAGLSGIFSPKPHAESAVGYRPATTTSLNITTGIGSSFLAIEDARANDAVLEQQVCDPLVKAMQDRLQSPDMTRTPLPGTTRIIFNYRTAIPGGREIHLSAEGGKALGRASATDIYGSDLTPDPDSWKNNITNYAVHCDETPGKHLQASGQIEQDGFYDTSDPTRRSTAVANAIEATRVIIFSLPPAQ